MKRLSRPSTRIVLFTCAALLAATSASSISNEAVKLEVQVIGSQGKLDTGTNKFASPSAEFQRNYKDDGAQVVMAPGAGLNVTFRLSEVARMGAGVAWINYDEGTEKPQYEDFSLHGNGILDLLHMNNFGIFGIAGLSYHWVDPKDVDNGAVKIGVDETQLFNFDVGLGSEVKLSENMNLGLTYRYSDTLTKGDMDTRTSFLNQTVKGQFEGITLTQNEILGSLGMVF